MGGFAKERAEPLDRPMRALLERSVREAREVAEAGARAAFGHLGVGGPAPPPYLDGEARSLRERLRLHGGQLGDRIVSGDGESDDAADGEGGSSLDLLIEETAYENWHRMLFARFLAENGLLMYPDPSGPVPVTIAECADLAADEGAADGWELAARFAAGMLPRIFRTGSPVFQVSFPPEHRQRLEGLIAGLPRVVFAAPDALGWVYQYWQGRRKTEVNDSEVKIGSRELPAVTQLFTEPYMAGFLLDNTLGAWWAARRLAASDLEAAGSEGELRGKAARPGMPLKYLRFVREGEGKGVGVGESPWSPAAGAFSRWPVRLADFRLLDPCIGSACFAVEAFRMLVPMRMELEGLSAGDAADAVLRDNIHGLEIDRRCVEIAAFALAMAAWTYPGAGGYRPLPDLNVACSGVPVNAAREDWAALAGDDAAARASLVGLHGQFRDAPLLGSLIDPARSMGDGELFAAGRIAAVKALARAVAEDRGDLASEIAVLAHGAAKAAAILDGRYHLIATNVPYLFSGRQAPGLRAFCEKFHSDAKNDLATVFLDRCLMLCRDGGTVAAVMPQNWLALSNYRKFRTRLLENDTWQLLARLGPGAFETISGEIVKAVLLVISHGLSSVIRSESRSSIVAKSVLRGIDVSGSKGASGKADALAGAAITEITQASQLGNPDARVSAEEAGTGELLSKLAYCHHGLTTGDNPRMRLRFWEFQNPGERWIPFRGTVESSREFGGVSHLLRWDGGSGSIDEIAGAYKVGLKAWGKAGVAVSQMGELPVSLYTGEAFDVNTSVIVPHDPSHLAAVWCFCSSAEYSAAVRKIDQILKVTTVTLAKVPFDIGRWSEVARDRYPHGLPSPYSDDPTQRIFHGHPCGSVIWDPVAKRTAVGPLRKDSTVLQVAVARLLGYRWPAELDPGMALADEQRATAARCEDLLKHTDDDGIVAIPAVRGETSAPGRLRDVLAAAYGDAWSTDIESALLRDAGFGGKSLDDWLRDGFFAGHCALFHHRPFIWQVWDGLRDGFSALLLYHKLTYKRMESLCYTYIGDWIARQKHDLKGGKDGARERITAAESLLKRLEAVIEGEAPYDIFTRYKPLESQPVGWSPDLEDGVRLNIRPFMMPPDVGRKGAGLLRDRPNIKWDKDRGKDGESSPWYHIDKGVRVNDRHLTLAQKRPGRA
jgi:hypothetical protein